MASDLGSSPGEAEMATPEIAVCVGMSYWKRRNVARLLQDGSRPVAFRRRSRPAVALATARGGAIAVWATRTPADLLAAAHGAKAPVIRVEDGFLRSVGLGCDLVPPCSIVLDSLGVHYDPGSPSALEMLLNAAAFDAALLARAERLARLIVARDVTKYNTGRQDRIAAPKGARLVLVPGQVEDDAAFRLGGAGVTGNLELLHRVRQAEPEAVILFKPHPDVDAGHRPGAVRDDLACRYADQIVRGVAMPALLAEVDAVHTLTSLAGFEALLRGREVTAHGQPFYAGWGLTRDLAPALPRRVRRLSLAELVAGALIVYPRYIDPLTGERCTPERLVERLSQAGGSHVSGLTRIRRLQGRLRRTVARLAKLT